VKDFEFIHSVNNGKAELRIFESIGGNGVNGAAFVDELHHVTSTNAETEILINSGGGAMVDGYSMFHATSELAKTHNIKIKITGLAASMAQLFSLAGTGLPSIVDYGMLLIHKPRIGGNPNPKDKFLAEGIEVFFQSALTAISGKTGIAKETLLELMSANNGEGTWLDAETAQKMGLVGEIIKTEKMAQVNAKMPLIVGCQSQLPHVMEVMMSAFEDKPDEDELVISKTDKYNMKEVLLELGLDELSKEDKALEMVISLKEDKEKAELKAETLEARVSEQDGIIASFEAAKIESFIDSKIESKQIKAESKDKWLERAKENFDMVSEVLNDLPSPTVVADITTVIDNKVTDKVESFRELEKSNPAKLKEIEKNNPELYAKMYDAEYKN
jgi:ATP-dependent protease ClpP protease subunit